MQTIWKLLESIIAILLKVQKYKTYTVLILPVFQIKHKEMKPITDVKAWYLNYICITK